MKMKHRNIADFPEHQKALDAFIELWGKPALFQAWHTGNYRGFVNSGLLQQIRNNWGPSWLGDYDGST